MKHLLTLIVVLSTFLSFSCTTFVLKDKNNLVFGRNLDWFSDDGLIVINKRNVKKTSLVFPPEKSISWVSKFGSVTFNQFGKEFPFGGINENGLVVEIMKVRTEYPARDNRPSMNESQWVQYQLDNAANIEDVIKSDKLVRISKMSQDLHFLICDKFGNTVVIEFSKNGMKVFRKENLPIPVLENDPYTSSLKKEKGNVKCRFTTATNRINDYDPNKHSIIDYSFDILNEVALSGSWSVVYDIKNQKIFFKTSSNKRIRVIDLEEINFSCSTECLVYDLKRKDEENINGLFLPFNTQLNNKKLDAAFISNGIRFPKQVKDKVYGYAKQCKCEK